MHYQDLLGLTISYPTRQNIPIKKKHSVLGVIFWAEEEWMSWTASGHLYIFLQVRRLCWLECILVSWPLWGETRQLRSFPKTRSCLGMTCKQYVFAYLRNKYYCLLCTSFYANTWEYNHGPGRRVCCLHRADERPRQREERETEREREGGRLKTQPHK